MILIELTGVVICLLIRYETMFSNGCTAATFSNKETPYHHFFHKHADLKLFKHFGCTDLICFPFTNRTKLDFKAERGTMVVIYEGTLCYHIYCHSTPNIVQAMEFTVIEDDDSYLMVNEF